MARMASITDAVTQGTRWYPDREALVQGGQTDRRSYTYAELNDESASFARALLRLGTDPGDRIAFLNRSTVEHTVAYFGALRAGAIPATLHFRESEAALRKMVEQIRPRILVFQPQLTDSARAIRRACPWIDEFATLDQLGDGPSFARRYTDLIESEDARARELPTRRPTDAAFINFSSGTTGVPKPVVHTHENIVESAHVGAFKYQLSPSTRTLKTNTPSFIAWANATFSHINAGATLVYLERSDPAAILRTVESERVTALILVPTVWKRVLNEDLGQYELQSVRRAGYAGEPLDSALFAAVRDAFTPNICAVYGTTETMSSSLILFSEYVTPETLRSVGYPAPNTEVRVIDPDRREPDDEVERGEAGELIVRGPSVATEIWDDPEATSRIFHDDGWVFTGDIGYVGEDNLLYIHGRKDNMIISGGINIYPERIKEIIGAHPNVADVAIIGVPDETWGETVTAVVVPNDDSVTERDIASICEESTELADYQRPRRYELTDALPKTGTNKIDYAALRARFTNRAE